VQSNVNDAAADVDLKLRSLKRELLAATTNLKLAEDERESISQSSAKIEARRSAVELKLTELTAELGEVRVQLASATGERDSVCVENKGLSSRVVELEAVNGELLRNNEELRGSVSASTDDVSTRETAVREAQSLLTAAELRISMLAEKEKELSEDVERLRLERNCVVKDRDGLSAHNDELRRKVSSLEEAKEMTGAELKTAEEKIRKLGEELNLKYVDSDYEVNRIQKELESEVVECEALSNEIAELKCVVQVTETALKEANDRLSTTEAEMSTLAATLESKNVDASGCILQLGSRLDSVVEERDTLSRKNSELQKDLLSQERESEKFSDELKNAEEKIHTLESELRSKDVDAGNEMERLRNDLQSGRLERDALSKRITELSSVVQVMETSAEEVTEKLRVAEANVLTLSAALETKSVEMSGDILQLGSQLDSAVEARDAVTSKVSELETKLQGRNSELEKTCVAVRTVEAEREVLKLTIARSVEMEELASRNYKIETDRLDGRLSELTQSVSVDVFFYNIIPSLRLPAEFTPPLILFCPSSSLTTFHNFCHLGFSPPPSPSRYILLWYLVMS